MIRSKKENKMIIKKLRENPLFTALFLVTIYALWFIVPMFFKDIDPNAKGIVGIEGAIKEGWHELVTASALVIFLSLLGWWQKIGFTSIKKGSFKFILPIIVIILIVLNLSWVYDTSGKAFMGFDSTLQLLRLLGVMLLLGFVEEGIFRGVLFYGLRSHFTPLASVFTSALIFGLFHFVNIFTGAEVLTTLYQVIHAFAMGFLYASLRLKLGALWPLIILHAMWDFSFFILQSTIQSPDNTSVSMTAGLSISIPALIYGIFVYWRWSKSTYTTMDKINY